MGFLSKLMKNPLMQMLAPMAMAWAAPYAFGATGLTSLFSGMNPMAANALKQSMLGYGTGMLTGAEDPGKQAMYAGIASLPFSYMNAATQAKNFNRTYGTTPGQSPIYGQVPEKISPMQWSEQNYMKEAFGRPIPKPNMIPGKTITGYANVDPLKKISAWDILSEPGGYKFDAPRYEMWDAEPIKIPTLEGGMTTHMDRPQLSPANQEILDANMFTKTSYGGTSKFGKNLAPMGTEVPDWIPTMMTQSAGALGEYIETQDERARKECARKKERRKIELAWMYGVPEDHIGGEMDNPWYTGGGFWNKGGIASLENGGGVDGPGTGTSDSIDAKLSDGEFVMTAKAVENLGNGDRYTGARKMYDMMNMLDPESEAMSEVV